MLLRIARHAAGRVRPSLGWLILPLALSCQAEALSGKAARYAQDHPQISMCVDPDWAPFETLAADGRYEGIAADLVRLAAQRAGLRLRLVPTRSWQESLQASRDGRCQILSFLNATPQRRQWLDFTAPLFRDVNVLITREEHPAIADPSRLSAASIALTEDAPMAARFVGDFPRVRVLRAASERDGLRMVSEGQATMTLRSLMVAAHTIKTQGWFKLKIAGELPGYANELRIGVRRGQPELLALLDRGARSISDADRDGIVNRHVPITVEAAGDDARAGWLAAGLLALLLGLGGWSLRLKRRNRELEAQSQTDVLTGLPNRAALDIAFARELAGARRHGRELAVLLVDLDHFKQVNDCFGHVQGDQVLCQFAEVLRATVRASDSCGRWGGEEFLLLCPATGEREALALAERLRQAVQSARFATRVRHSVSIGVAWHRPGDTALSLLQRADQALYRAKRGGRNQVRGHEEAAGELAGQTG
ncbi:diguanylate cyclase [Xenophilus sp. AP218F]|nr:diguanylate cyclase [Chromobacterium sp. ASV5]OWY41057.1 diguanylate cyclase [Xenophilus sp. AP218F]